VVGAAIALCGGATACADDEILARIKGDFDARYARFGRVRYEIEGSSTATKGTVSALMGYKDPMPAQDVSWPERRLYVADFASARFRKEERGYVFALEKGVLTNVGQFNVFDGKRHATFDPRELNTSPVRKPGPMQPDVYLENRKEAWSVFGCPDYPILFAHGIVPPTSGKVDLLALRDDACWRWITQTGTGEIGGRNCVILHYRNPNDLGRVYNEYWVDLERESAVVRWTSYSSGIGARPTLEIQYRQTEHGWLPERWLMIVGADSAEHRFIDELRVVAFDPEPIVDSKTFSTQPEPGMIVRTFSPGPRGIPHPSTFRAGADGALIPIDEETGRELAPYARRLWNWNVYLVVGALAIPLWRWTFRRRHRPPVQKTDEKDAGA
jgi:hypothetical protein